MLAARTSLYRLATARSTNVTAAICPGMNIHRPAYHRPFSTEDGGGNSSNKSSSTAPEQQYVHPLSQIVLEHLQTSQTDYVTKAGLGKLAINKDGTFTLQFPDSRSSGGGGGGGGGKIWTSFDPEEKKHWLTVHKGELVGRYMLQDNMKPAWHSDKRSVHEKVQDAVDEMIRKLSE